MKKLINILILPLLALNLAGQNNSVLQFELGTGMINSVLAESDHAQAVSLNGTLRFQHKSVSIGLRYEHAVSTIGIEGPIGVPRFSRFTDVLQGRESEFSNYKSIQLRFDYSPVFENFRPIFGIGYSGVFLKNEVIYYDRYLSITDPPRNLNVREERNFYPLLYHLGYSVKDIRYGLTVIPLAGRNLDRIVETSISYSFGLSKRKSVPEDKLDMNMHWKSNPIFIRLEIGRSLLTPLQKHYAAAAGYFVSAQLYIFNNFYLGAAFEKDGTRMGYDKNTVDVRFFPGDRGFYVRKTDISTKISARKVFVHKFKSISRNADFYYGGGVGLYRIEDAGEDTVISYINSPSPTTPPLAVYPPEIEATKNVGLLVSIGLRTGWFNNRLEINIPFGKIPVYASLQTAIGIQTRRRASKSK